MGKPKIYLLQEEVLSTHRKKAEIWDCINQMLNLPQKITEKRRIGNNK